MKRRTLDLAFSIGGTIFAVLLLVLGFVLKQQADFADDYVDRELSAQNIAFPDEYARGETEVAGSGCLTRYAGEQVNTGSEAECFARYYIATHMMHSAEEAGYAGETYASMGTVTGALRADLVAAQDAGDDAAIEEVQAKLDAANSLRDSMFKGETLRGMLLTVYGFSVFGDKASMAMWVCWIGGVLLLILSVAGFVHASTRTAKEHVVV